MNTVYMFNFWSKKSEKSENSQSSGELSWDAQAESAINQAVAGAPVPGMLKNRLKSQLRGAAQKVAKDAGSTKVTAEHVMQGLLSQLPANMRTQVEKAMKKGPAGLAELQKKFRK